MPVEQIYHALACSRAIAGAMQGDASPRKVPQKITAHRSFMRRWVRLKMCGKSAQHWQVIVSAGKPHSEQDKAAQSPFAASDARVCRLDKWLPRSNAYRIRLICRWWAIILNYGGSLEE
jgi:hypothetical protein